MRQLPSYLFPRLADPDDAEAIRIGDDALSYRELAGTAAAVAARARGAGRVAVFAQPSPELCIAVVGALAAGVAVVPINPSSGSGELGHIVSDSEPGLVLARRDAELPPALAQLERVDVDRTANGGALPDELGAEDTAILLYTSGTTGPPKGVMLPRRAIESNLDALAEVWEWTGDDRAAHALPLFHVHGLVLGTLGPLRRGGSVHHVGRFSTQALAQALRDGATMVFGVPTMYHRIAAEAEQDREIAEAFGTARVLVAGSAALPAAEHHRLEKLTGRRVVERYGLTETLMNCSVRLDDPPLAGYVGRPLPGVEVRLVDDDRKPMDVSDDETIGEIAVRGPNLFTGYLNREDATAEAMHDGFFHTGDLATRTPEGHIRIVGRRATDLIKSGGYKIGAGEIESALLEHPAVAEAAVAGREDTDLGERVVAWVVLAPDAEASADELRSHVGELLAKHKRPRDVHFVSELPRNEMGKVMKRALQP